MAKKQSSKGISDGLITALWVGYEKNLIRDIYWRRRGGRKTTDKPNVNPSINLFRGGISVSF